MMTLLVITAVNSSFDVIVNDYITRDKLVISSHQLLISEIVYLKKIDRLILQLCLLRGERGRERVTWNGKIKKRGRFIVLRNIYYRIFIHRNGYGEKNIEKM